MTLLLKNISKIYSSNVGKFEVFKNINFEIKENEISKIDLKLEKEYVFIKKELQKSLTSFL